MKPEFTYDTLLQNLINGESFSWSRWGDGEWNAVLQNRPGASNCDGHEYFPDMGARLKQILESRPAYFLGLQRLATEQNMDNAEFQRLRGMNEWCENELLHHASIKGRLGDFFDALKVAQKKGFKEILVVGNLSLAMIKQLPAYHHQVIPQKNCWLEFEDIRHELRRSIDSVINSGSDVIILYAASMMTNVLVDDIYNEYEHMVTQIDCGSVFDPYVGRNTRSYHHKLNLQ